MDRCNLKILRKARDFIGPEQLYRAMGQGTEGPALWLVDYREDLRILFVTALDGVPELQTDLAALVRAKFCDYDAWRRGLAPAPE